MIKYALAHNEGDGEFIARLKNAGGGAIVGGGLDAAVSLFKLVEHLRADPKALATINALAAMAGPLKAVQALAVP